MSKDILEVVFREACMTRFQCETLLEKLNELNRVQIFSYDCLYFRQLLDDIDSSIESNQRESARNSCT